MKLFYLGTQDHEDHKDPLARLRITQDTQF